VGKTGVSIELAKHYNTAIISADSRQCYRELNIGVARPSEQELGEVEHFFIATHSIREEVTAVTFEQYALQKVGELFLRHDKVIMVGGTGLYIKAFCEGLHDIPAIDPQLREKIVNQYSEKGLNWLQEEIRKKDPQFFEEGEIRNPQRIMRALEVVEATGRPIFSFRKGTRPDRNFSIKKIGLDLPKEELHLNINKRVNRMMEAGLLEEVRNLLPFRNLNALQTVGYTELFDYLDGMLSLDTAVEKIKTNTRRYAKRQLTWFRRDPEINWFSPISITAIKSRIDEK
jgi:tRNA dimethylallyltransferase